MGEVQAPIRATGWALFVLRVFVGGLYLLHGIQRLRELGSGAIPLDPALTPQQVGLLQDLGPIVGGIEFLGGALLLVGLFTRLICFPLLLYVGALLFDFAQRHGSLLLDARTPRAGEHYLLLLGCLLTFLVAGAGRFSLDGLFVKKE